MTNLDAFTAALRRASEAHPELRIGQLILRGYVQSYGALGWWHNFGDTPDPDLTAALNRFADKGEG
jgi:hypothetical protein